MVSVQFGAKYPIWGSKAEVDTAVKKITRLNLQDGGCPTAAWEGLPGSDTYAKASIHNFSSIKTVVVYTGAEDVAEFNRMHPRWEQYETVRKAWLQHLSDCVESIQNLQERNEAFNRHIAKHEGEVTLDADLEAYVQSLPLPYEIGTMRLEHVPQASSIIAAIERGAFDAFSGTFGYPKVRGKRKAKRARSDPAESGIFPA